ncbi:MAG: class II aldolase/adducin family protein, partial [Patescibacteria group bacterium]
KDPLTGQPKARFIDPQDLCIVTLDNKILRGNPSGERLMHLAVYRNEPRAKAVVHAHPPTAIAWSIARPQLQFLPSDCMSEVILAVGAIALKADGNDYPSKQTHGFLLKNSLVYNYSSTRPGLVDAKKHAFSTAQDFHH